MLLGDIFGRQCFLRGKCGLMETIFSFEKRWFERRITNYFRISTKIHQTLGLIMTKSSFFVVVNVGFSTLKVCNSLAQEEAVFGV